MEAPRHAWRRIGELFVEKALITGPELEQALAVQAACGRPLGEVLVSEGLISSAEMTEVIMEQVGRKVAKEDGFGSPRWSEIRCRTLRVRAQQLATRADSAHETHQRVPQLVEHLADTQLALALARGEAAATKDELDAAEKRIGELTVMVDRLEAEREGRFQTDPTWRRTVKRSLFGSALRLAQQ